MDAMRNHVAFAIATTANTLNSNTVRNTEKMPLKVPITLPQILHEEERDAEFFLPFVSK
jgi:hypothetical protein